MEFDLEGGERFGRILSWFYSVFAGRTSNFGMYQFVVDDVLTSDAKSLLDVGTGPGRVPMMLASKRPGLKIYAVDPSPYMLKHARRKAAGSGISFANGYSNYIPFHRKFDLIISSLSFHHWAHKKESMRYLSGFLVKGGEIRIYEFRRAGPLRFHGPHSMDIDEIRRAAEGSGLRAREIIEKGDKLRATFVKKD